MKCLLFAAVLLCVTLFVNGAPPLNIHIIAHTHDDVGWLKTVDQYYYGANNTIQRAGVQYILDTVVSELQKNPARRFIYVEIAFFKRWWNQQNEGMKTVVRDLVRRGQLEFINGGWTMSDEACIYYTDGVDQMTEGHLFLLREFGVVPTIGWQIDPFGHAAAQATQFALMGFNGFFFARSDYQDYELRNKTKSLESIWRPSPSLGSRTDIFTHILYDSTYCEPEGLSFQDDDVQPVMWDKTLEGYNLDKKADQLVAHAKKMTLSYQSNNVLITFGCDFQFQDADINFKNMDRLMDYINENTAKYGAKIFYSTPSTYLEYVHGQSEITWPLNTHDYFPYRDGPYSVWSGYFSSRSALKGYVRTRSSVVTVLNTLLTTASGFVPAVLNNENYERQNRMAHAQGLLTHHDAVSGTEKQHVADDYARHLSRGTADSDDVINDVLGKLFKRKSSSAAVPQFQTCKLLNISVCHATNNLASGLSVPVVAYNPLAWNRVSNFRIPVPRRDVVVVDANGKQVPSQITPNSDIRGVFTITFSLSLGPLSYTSVVLEVGHNQNFADHQAPKVGAPNSIENSHLIVNFEQSTGHLSAITNRVSGQTLKIDGQILWWNASAGNNVNSSQASGAYIFRPNGTHPWNVSTDNHATISIVHGPVVSEVYQFFSNWAYAVYRLFSGSNHVEAEYSIGPIPIADHLGKEIITSYTTNLRSNATWYSDSQGLEFQTRIRNYRYTYKLNVTEPVALNYVPCDTAGYIQDHINKNRFTVIHDRAGGCGSLNDGQIDFMVHRRLLYDDGRGVGEPLNESMQVRTSEFLLFENGPVSARQQRPLSLEVNYPSALFFATNYNGVNGLNWFRNYNTEFKGLNRPLPPNVHLQTLRTLDTGEVILRLDHIYAVGEDSEYSKRVSVDLSGLFTGSQIVDLREMQLTAVESVKNVRRYTWKISGEEETKNGETDVEWYVGEKLEDLVVELDPMDIRTFLVRLVAVGK
eukprot:TRINITY_DN367_c0_g1_i1.p1 TRINITY_DN367_c0_g1~~TRINITY_DN367_c0_g1_i1.p1  ORF type:complete len:994 (-),score=215.51 TRINITY_DN367_c0_g1_i1:47-2986(-)